MNVQNHRNVNSIPCKDALKNGEGTEFVIVSITLDAAVPAHIFSKSELKK